MQIPLKSSSHWPFIMWPIYVAHMQDEAVLVSQLASYS